MFDLDAWQEIFSTLRKNRLRTALTALGVFLGVFILLIMLWFGKAMANGVAKQMAGFATNAVFVWGERTSEAYAGLPTNRAVEFDNGDVTALRQLDEIEHLAPRNQLGGFRTPAIVKHGGKAGTFEVAGDYPDFQYVQEPVMKAGRFLNDRDIAERRKIAVIGEGVIKQLYKPTTQPIGSYIEVNGIYFLVVGVFGTRQSGSNGDQITNRIHLPFSTFQQSFNTGDDVGWFAITGKSHVDAEVLEAKIRELLAKRHKVSPTDKMAIGSWNAGKEFRKISNLFLGINTVMWIAGLFSLAAGVIGVSNIMLISVRERTKEIGVRKALGATPGRIVRMIVAEAVVLTTLAGYLGVFWGTVVTEILDFGLTMAGDDIPFAPALLDISIGGVAAVMIAVFGALAGVIPAYHAAKIQPIEALRTE